MKIHVIIMLFEQMSVPRVRQVYSKTDKSPPSLQQKWDKKADQDFHQVYNSYIKMAKECAGCYHTLRISKDKKERKQAKKLFLALYPDMTALHKIGLNDYIPYETIQKFDSLHYNLCTRR